MGSDIHFYHVARSKEAYEERFDTINITSNDSRPLHRNHVVITSGLVGNQPTEPLSQQAVHAKPSDQSSDVSRSRQRHSHRPCYRIPEYVR